MGMSIDEAIKQIIECKAYKQCDMEKDSEAFEVAVEIMRKYQKIEQILDDCKECDLVNDFALDEIKKVVEDDVD